MPPDLPPGRSLELGERGTTFIRELSGPKGAPTVLLLHGWTVTADLNWFRCYEALGKEFHVVAMDHRGHGRGIRSRRFRLEDCADDAVALADTLHVATFIPVGYSMGGAVAQLIAHRHPTRLRGLVLGATARQFHLRGADPALSRRLSPVIATVASLTPARLRQNLFEAMGNGREPGSDFDKWAASEVRRSDPAAMAQALVEIQRFDSRDWVGEISVPTAVIVTTQDETVPTLRQRRLVGALANPTVTEIVAPHRAPVENADVFVPALLASCRAVSR
jgi:3-oxoadipate enol-lactonase